MILLAPFLLCWKLEFWGIINSQDDFLTIFARLIISLTQVNSADASLKRVEIQSLVPNGFPQSFPFYATCGKSTCKALYHQRFTIPHGGVPLMRSVDFRWIFKTKHNTVCQGGSPQVKLNLKAVFVYISFVQIVQSDMSLLPFAGEKC